MKKLFALISTEGKTREQIVKETWEAFQKYKKVSEKIEKDMVTKDKNKD